MNRLKFTTCGDTIRKWYDAISMNFINGFLIILYRIYFHDRYVLNETVIHNFIEKIYEKSTVLKIHGLCLCK